MSRSAVEIILSYVLFKLLMTNTYCDFMKIYSVSWEIVFSSSSKIVEAIA